MKNDAKALLAALWSELAGPADLVGALEIDGPTGGLPSIYAVAELAAAQIGAATLAAAELLAARERRPIRLARVDRRHAVAAFRSERYLRPIGWQRPPPWDPVAGDYRTRDGFIRLHTNYASHRAAALGVLEAPAERDPVARAVLAWNASDLEEAVVRAGGAAAAMRTDAEWRKHPQGAAVAAEPLVAMEATPGQPAAMPDPAGAPLAGIRVLDLTRVIAGPVCTRFLAAWGADVLRIDPPGFDEVGALLAETTAGKRRAELDLRDARGRTAFERLASEAHVLVSSYRGDALERLGLSAAALRMVNPALILASIDAYGYTGPWRHRRGFDSLVQMSCGIAARGQEAAGAEIPVPLPAQALDHGCGYLLAAAVCRALTRRLRRGEAGTVRASLARTARLLTDVAGSSIAGDQEFTAQDAEPWLETVDSAWGPLARVRCPGSIAGITPGWSRPAGPLGTDPPTW
jgi:hypothetical protein